jgi:hypothetical protein
MRSHGDRSGQAESSAHARHAGISVGEPVAWSSFSCEFAKIDPILHVCEYSKIIEKTSVCAGAFIGV